jgi:hypothetical protein
MFVNIICPLFTYKVNMPTKFKIRFSKILMSSKRNCTWISIWNKRLKMFSPLRQTLASKHCLQLKIKKQEYFGCPLRSFPTYETLYRSIIKSQQTNPRVFAEIVDNYAEKTSIFYKQQEIFDSNGRLCPLFDFIFYPSFVYNNSRKKAATIYTLLQKFYNKRAKMALDRSPDPSNSSEQLHWQAFWPSFITGESKMWPPEC